ncbi:indolepyruvate ferredoxin oxidoreductase, alpha subunit [Acididesulfobacillus acetoxydans]|uniref:Indolepyruvate oxidoreductase subunit IorA n=1 Tax=Acididesulfobacillus acetoxydans TaxID=1561005 RepID=A0A8S0W2Y6_9FIRM|nr:indolepyruvate ferredoxin oxidoreductase subunit alpha [Acididesulfobacillus acetoxydans]CAA7601128.1 indolepyruvate ferredoxin oxidoreductase, alpha subunit [Acididesulfobacillus acetoxydans]CEJ08593.1 Indolepyruvate oxidoreductase subunit IorA [Acididesulfobacillus acetoxydans]
MTLTSPDRRTLMAGNTAIARGAYEAGVYFASGYPGTPSTEILENIAHYPEIRSQWAANEKVAFDEAMGVALSGKRALCSMKYVGLNVASDSFMVFPFAGTIGGFVVISADDPGMYSSQNEQDNRYLARMAQVPMIEPSDPQEAKDYVKLAYELSEMFSTPVLYRTSMRVSHSKGIVALGERGEYTGERRFVKDVPNWVVPIFAKSLRAKLDAKMERLTAFAESYPFNRVEEGKSGIGIITSGASYTYAKEVFPEASFLKLALTNPLPRQKISDFCARHEVVYVIEELEPFLEEQIRAWGLTNIVGKDRLPRSGEYNPDVLAQALLGEKAVEDFTSEFDLISRPPQLCPGCPHRGAYLALKKAGVLVTGDIGCYTLGALPPLGAMHTSFCMGASIGHAFGFELGGMDKVVAVMGDSTFIHGGIPSLIDVVYNGGNTTTVILDNRTTGMTGHQEHPATGMTLQGKEAPRLDLVALIRAIGVKHVQVADPFRQKEMFQALQEALQHEGPSVILTNRPCIFARGEKDRAKTPYVIREDKCTQCGACQRLGCPGVLPGEQPRIDEVACTGCSLCAQACKFDAIVLKGVV